MKKTARTLMLATLLTACCTSFAFASAVRTGDQGDKVMKIQEQLASLGYDVVVDGTFGPSTREAVKDFQKNNGLDSDGLVGSSTYQLLFSEEMPAEAAPAETAAGDGKNVYERALLSIEHQGTTVQEVQQQLANLGYNISADGKFGPRTQKAIQAFQRENGLEIDGLVGPNTYAKLFGVEAPAAEEEPQETAVYDEEVSRGSNLIARRIMSTALQYIGVPYVFGGTSPDYGFDCSGYVQYVYAMAGIDLPRTADVQYECGYEVSKDQLIPGDLVFFETYEPGASHVGIYIGNGEFIDSTDGGVTVESLYSDYRMSCYYGARRVI